MGAYVRILIVASFVIGAIGCAPADVRPAFRSGVCHPTPVVERVDVGLGYVSPVRLVVGGDLAGQPLNHGKGYPTSMSPGNYWYLRRPQARPSITLRAERLDRSEAVTFAAHGYRLGPGFVSEWAPADWYYRTAVEALEILPAEGCWRISLVDGGPDDAVVYHLKKVELPAR